MSASQIKPTPTPLTPTVVYDQTYCSRDILDTLETEQTAIEDKVIRLQDEINKVRDLMIDLDESADSDNALDHLKAAEAALDTKMRQFLKAGKEIIRKELDAEGSEEDDLLN